MPPTRPSAPSDPSNGVRLALTQVLMNLLNLKSGNHEDRLPDNKWSVAISTSPAWKPGCFAAAQVSELQAHVINVQTGYEAEFTNQKAYISRLESEVKPRTNILCIWKSSCRVCNPGGSSAPHARCPASCVNKVLRMTNELPTVSVVVLNYNGLKHLEPCFKSLLALGYPPARLELMFVDNASRDDSVRFMREQFPTVRVVETGANLGFAAGNNYGAEHATGDYVAFLNNDTRVEPRWLSEMVRPSWPDATRARLHRIPDARLGWRKDRLQVFGVNFHGFGFQPSYGKPYKPDELAPRRHPLCLRRLDAG